MATDDSLQLRLPEQDLSRLSVGSDNPKKLQAWVDALPPINLGETARQLYQYLQELNRLQLDARKRLPLLEITQPAVEHVCQGLSKHYLNQPLILPEKARKVASLAQALQGHLANGYKLTAVYGQARLPDKEARNLVALSCYRATSALTNALLRCYQLYFPIPAHLWLEIHQLYLLTERHGLAGWRLDAAENATPSSAYLRALLLAAARPNQLRQQESSLVYQIARDWSDWVAIRSEHTRDDLFAVELNMDTGPIYDSQLTARHGNCRYLDTRKLIQQLSLRPEMSELKLPKGILPSLVAHLRQAWGSLAERSFKRISQQGQLELCLGLGAVHYFVTGGEGFNHFMRTNYPLAFGIKKSGDNPFSDPHKKTKKTEVDDPWSQAYKPTDAIIGDQIDFSALKSSLQNSDDDQDTSFDLHAVTKINASPGGYCLSWLEDTPIQLRTGELVAIRDGHPEWAIGVVRWVRQLPNGGAEFGVEVMAPRAQPCAAKAVKKTGEEANFMRALLLPALQAVGQPITLLLPTVGFQTGQKVDLLQGGENSRVLLTRQLSGSASYNLYLFRDASPGSDKDELPQPEQPNDNKNQFDSIWSNL